MSASQNKKCPEHINLERWLISYADFITLLFAFFVVLWITNIENTSKYKILSMSIYGAFNILPKSMEPIQVGQIAKSQYLNLRKRKKNIVEIRKEVQDMNRSIAAISRGFSVKNKDDVDARSRSDNQSKDKDKDKGPKSSRIIKSSTLKVKNVNEEIKKEDFKNKEQMVLKNKELKESDIESERYKEKIKERLLINGAATSRDRIKESKREMLSSVAIPKKFLTSTKDTLLKKKSENKKGIDDSSKRVREEFLAQIEKKFRKNFHNLINKDILKVRHSNDWVEIELNNMFFFKHNSYSPSPSVIPVVSKIAAVLKSYKKYKLSVIGHTDNLDISGSGLKSSWELGAMRAASIISLLEDFYIDPRKMALISYGQYKPNFSNDTAKGRKKNRRTVIRISAEPQNEDIVDVVKKIPIFEGGYDE